MVKGTVVRRDRLLGVCPTLHQGVEIYRQKTPHEIGSLEEIFEFLTSPEGDELFVFTHEGQYAGFMTFKVQPFEGEVWGTLAMVYVTPEGQKAGVLAEAAQLVEEELRCRGCTVMNYMTAREGFRRLAPRLGFRPRIIEWMKELN
jgi:GNAT superfamily N-acetyltransferase